MHTLPYFRGKLPLLMQCATRARLVRATTKPGVSNERLDRLNLAYTVGYLLQWDLILFITEFLSIAEMSTPKSCIFLLLAFPRVLRQSIPQSHSHS